jgi:hypothetical protein
MAENYTPNPVATFVNDTTAVNTVNNNFAAISTVFTDVLSRSGVTPNQMTSSLDMNSNQIINLPPPASLNSPLRLADLGQTLSISINNALTGTSGHLVPFLDGANTWSNTNAYTQNNASNQLSLVTPNPTGAGFDTTPLAALFIDQAPAPTTRNFLAGLWIKTNAATTDKGRGIIINNLGASDGVYIQNDGAGSTGLASLVTVNATGASTGAVIGTTLATHVGLAVRQETSVLANASCAFLLQLTANGSSPVEMATWSSTLAGQSAITMRLFGGLSNAITVIDNAARQLFLLNNQGGMTLGANGSLITPIFQLNGNSTGSASISVSATGSLLNLNTNMTVDTTGNILNNGSIRIATTSSVVTGGAANSGFMYGNASGLGVFFGNGAPTLSALQGSIYIRTDGSSTSTRLYVNTNGSTGWTNFTSAT